MRHFILTYTLIPFCILISGCSLPRNNVLDGKGSLPILTTNTISVITQNSALSGGVVISAGASPVIARGVCWDTITNPTINLNTTTKDSLGVGSFVSAITGLKYSTKYYLRAYATNSFGTNYGNLDSFITALGNVPTLITDSVTNIVGNSATCGGSIISDGGLAITSKGVIWGTDSTNLQLNTFSTYSVDGSGNDSYVSNITGLYTSSESNYYVRAYASNSAGTGYGSTKVFYPGSMFFLGQFFGGGIIYFIDSTGRHGLIAAPFDQVSSPVEWGCSGINIIGADGSNIGNGKANTNAILALCLSAGVAAYICKNLSIGGYTDWYLPSYTELLYMSVISRSPLGGVGNVGNFDTSGTSNLSTYWSSTQLDSNNAYESYFSAIPFNNNYSGYMSKNSVANVRACRTF